MNYFNPTSIYLLESYLTSLFRPCHLHFCLCWSYLPASIFYFFSKDDKKYRLNASSKMKKTKIVKIYY